MGAKKRKPVRIKPPGRSAAGEVAGVFRGYPPKLRGKLLALRRLILDTAAKTDGAGAIQETLKWGQPSYLTNETGSGTTIRIDRMKRGDDRYAIFFHCQSGLVPMFRDLYGDKFEYEGKRAIVMHVDDRPDEEALAHCLSLALTHHARKKTKQK